MQFRRPADRAVGARARLLFSDRRQPLPTPSLRPAIQLGEVSVDCRGLDLNFAQPSCCQAEPFQSAECGHIRC